jgi:hypothetical protein
MPTEGIPNTVEETLKQDMPSMTDKLFAPLHLVRTGLPRRQGEPAPSMREPRFDDLKSDIKFYSFFMFTVPFAVFFYI